MRYRTPGFSRLCLFLLLFLAGATAQAADPSFTQAQKEFDKQNYAAAAKIYGELLSGSQLPEGINEDELIYRQADATWRNLASTSQSDPKVFDAARQQLNKLAEKLIENTQGARPPVLWAKIQESLGDSYWIPRQNRRWDLAWPHYEKALNWWAGSTKLIIARKEYLDIVLRAAKPPQIDPYWRYGYYGANLPREVLFNTLDLAETPEQKAFANYMLAETVLTSYRDERHDAGAYYEAALAAGKDTEWRDDALFEYARWAALRGSFHYNDQGNLVQQPDYSLAVKLYRQFLNEYDKGESRFWNQAQDQLKSITDESLDLNLYQNFLPDSIVQFDVSWRNLESVSVEVFPIDLEKVFKPGDQQMPFYQRDDHLFDLSAIKPIESLTRQSDKVPYGMQRSTIEIPKGLAAGTYVVRAKAGDQVEEALLFVTEYALTVLRDRETLLVWVTNAITGEPAEKANVLVWVGRYINQNGKRTLQWIPDTAVSGEDGLVRFTSDGLNLADNTDLSNYPTHAILAYADGQPVISQQNNFYWNHSNFADQWRVYASTDRPAYRPEDTIHWKATARTRIDQSTWSNPAGVDVYYRIYGPRGVDVAEGTMTLNDFGSIWGDLTAKPDWALGMYTIEFRKSKTGRSIGAAQLFRLEEYKLPEYKVSVSAESSDGKANQVYQLGDSVDIEIQADYYFGGAVANADVTIIVRQSPYYHYWHRPTRYPWLYRHQSTRFHGGYGRVIKQETMKTDAKGRVSFSLDTNANEREDQQFTIEARVTDESRREVAGSTTVKVTREPYFVYLNPERRLYRPGEKAVLNIKTVNANEIAVSVEGKIWLVREEWKEVWRGPDGKQLSGKEFRKRQHSSGLFSSELDPTEWTRISGKFVAEDITDTTLKTNANGEATFSFDVNQAGYYRVYWVSRPENNPPIRRDAAVWVADTSSVDIGYHGPLEIITDEEAFRAGQQAPVMLTSDQPGRWVLYSVDNGKVLHAQVLYLEGNVKLIQNAVTDEWIPNVWLQADANFDLRPHQDRKEIVIPPEKEFIDVSIEPNANNYEPQETGSITIKTTDVDGKPLPAEVSLSVFDQSVLAIQPSLAPDPREFFYGEKRYQAVHTTTSFQTRGFRVIDPTEAIERQASAPMRENRGERSFQLDAFAMSRSQSPSPVAAMGKVAGDPFAGPPAGGLMELAEQGGQTQAPVVVVRQDFRATALWKPAIITNDAGEAVVEVTFPDSLTTWEMDATAVGLTAKFGEGTAEAKTRLPLIARLQTPRFFVTTDTVTLSGVFTNNTESELAVEGSIEIDGGLTLIDSATQSISIPPQSSKRINWTVSVDKPGDSVIKLVGKSNNTADAMQLTIPAFERGIEKFLAQSGKMKTDELSFALNVPAFRKQGAEMKLYLTPSIAVTMLDALPYLAQYPYGCTEQTMSRFLPAVVVANTLNGLGLDPTAVMNESFGGIEASTPTGIVEQNQNRKKNDGQLDELDSMVAAGLKRLTDFQHPNGGWGWWKTGETDPFMSAYVTWGLTLAQQSGQEIDSKIINQARDYLGEELVNFEDRLDMQAWLMHALASARKGDTNPKPNRFEARAFANLWKNREQLNAYSRALTALSAHWLGFKEEATILAENLENGAKVDGNPQASALLDDGEAQPDGGASLATAHWGEDGIFWRWSKGGVEATAFVLMALVEIKPDSKLVEPTMNWLVKNRRGGQWSNTRDTAIVVLALNEWLTKSGELDAGGTYTAVLNGESIGEISVTPETVISSPAAINIPVEKLDEGKNTFTLQRKAGDSDLYFSAHFSFFSTEDPVTAAGNELFVKRSYDRVYPVKTLLDGFRSRSVRLNSGDTVNPGDRIQATVTIEAKNNLEYVLIEDLKPAGLEAVALQSGAPIYAREVRIGALDSKDRYTGRRQWVYQELRDRQIACFIDSLPQGTWEISYELRAEAPGQFSALPTLAEAMYVPEIRGNSSEVKIKIVDTD
ncbi:MAG: MG2 domain-containing protein [Verrucomicrobiota bacterium]